MQAFLVFSSIYQALLGLMECGKQLAKIKLPRSTFGMTVDFYLQLSRLDVYFTNLYVIVHDVRH